MPYNTRRKSLSLSELGIIVPKRSRTASHPSPPNTIIEGEEPPVKKSKRLHSSSSPPPPGLMSPPRTTTIRFKEEKPKQAVELSPPPSPAAEGSNKVDVEGISDDIVVGTIQQIEKTGNRPHLVKELAHVLASSLHAVEKLFFYLTTTTHQPIPEVAEPFIPPKRTLSPPQSSASAADEEDDRYNRPRTALSPSPEVDLSSPELEQDSTNQPPTQGAPFSGRNSLARDSRSSSLSHPKRAASPQLEREERDFKQTANQLYEQAQLRRNSSQQDSKQEQADTTAGADREDESSISMSIEETEEHAALRHHDDAAALFGHAELLKVPSSTAPLLMDFSSPMMRPLSEVHLDAVPSSPMKADLVVERTERMSLDAGAATLPVLDTTGFGWEALRSPEMVGVAELEDLFGDY
ncbi:hypothetical protein LTS16_021803 [Friedmanniomyces endolithicus]|nr:hypothetical protein LTR75_015718 [Friedmanniomyces endolithicus]KAK0830166.1 hypothetical protein LTR03_015951 [Friedmanniomyces endolithicus]KAK0897787.1 hypothetical protein LTR57_021941 [Friedmanniomyces endolithicus]KAK0968355.1 hypothetical protein LTS01_016731 [Friedmanniomyces endolithicus]KAK1027049.1 hypothetical protein LTS16_021803 [Friedmanniomyces endolithicus]